MNRVFKMAGLAACFAAVVVLSGGHWLALQSLAWGRMVMSFSQRDSLSHAIAKTFSGKYPCRMCLKIRADWRQEKEREEKAPWTRIEQLPEALWQLRAATIPPAPITAREEQPCVPRLHSDFIGPPPKPPPRISCAVL
jgi:hypothetical protein